MNNISSSKVTAVNFEGQVFSVGIDVHKNSWKVSVVLRERILKTFSCDPNVEVLLKSLTNLYSGANFKFCYEAGFCGFWIHRSLTLEGYDCIVINPADVPSTQKDRVTKNDTVDSRKLAKQLEKNELVGIHIPIIKDEAIRDLYRLRANFVKNQTRLKNQIKSFMNRFPNEISDELKDQRWSKKFICWLKSLKFGDEELTKISFHHYLRELEHVISEVKIITKELSNILKANEEKKEIFKLLKTISGISTISSMALITELISMKRFKNDDHLNSYIGFIPSTASSGDKENSRGITFRHKKKLREILIESAWIAIGKDPALLLAFEKLCKRMPKNKAIIRIAKKLVRRIRYVWTNKVEYVVGVVQ